MKPEPEHRYCEISSEGRTLEGDAIVYGDVATFPWGRERIQSGAFGDVGDVILNRQHQRTTPIARTGGGGLTITDSPQALSIRADLPAGVAAADETLALVRSKVLRGLSVEFFSRLDHIEGDMRVIQKADLVGISVVDSGSYPASLVSARAAAMQTRARSGRTLRSKIPANVNLACQCSGAACKFARFAQSAIDEMLDTAFAKVEGEIGKETIAAWGNFENPLASVSRRTLRRSGKYGIDIDVPDSLAGDALLSAQEDAGIIVRPFLDAAESVSTIDGDVAVYSVARARAFIVSSSDQRSGWPTPQLIETPEAVREAPRKRRVWL